MSGNTTPGRQSNTDPALKDKWSTRWSTFNDAQRLYGAPLVFDVAAEKATSKCGDNYFGPDHINSTRRDGLAREWPASWWCNPPFTLKRDFILQARAQQAAGRPGIMLLPYEPCNGWWRELLAEDVIIYEPDGRIPFYEPDGCTKASGVNFPSALVCFPLHKIGPSVRVPYQRTFDPIVRKKKVVDKATIV